MPDPTEETRLELAARAAFMAFQHDVEFPALWESVPEEMRVTFRMIADAVLMTADRASAWHERGRKAERRELADKVSALTIWVVPAGYASNSLAITSHEVVRMVRVDELKAVFRSSDD